MKIAIWAVTALAPFITQHISAATGDANADYLTLCAAWGAGVKLHGQSYTPPRASEDLQDILYYNMSVADKSWHDLFDGSPAKGGWEKFKTSSSGKLQGANWENSWDTWKEQRDATKDRAQGWAKEHEDELAQTDYALVRGFVNKTAAMATELFNEANKPLLEGNTELNKAIKDKVEAALCAAPLTAQSGKPACKDISGTPAKADTCTNNGAGKGGKALGLDLICLCATETAAECTGDGGATAEIIATTNFEDNILTELLGKCPSLHDDYDPYDAAKTAVNMLRTRIGASKGGAAKLQVFLGKKHATNCGSSGSACVEYTDFFVDKKKGVDGIPWVANLLAAAEYYKRIKDRQASGKAILDEIKKLKRDIQRELTRPAAHSTIPNAQPTTATAAQKEKEATACKRQTTNTSCTANNCKWVGESDTKGECKPKPGTEATAAGTAGNGATGATTEKCKGKEQKDCKDGCNWDGKECKDSSFLLNKQFALSVVSAAFMALLF